MTESESWALQLAIYELRSKVGRCRKCLASQGSGPRHGQTPRVPRPPQNATELVEGLFQPQIRYQISNVT